MRNKSFSLFVFAFLLSFPSTSKAIDYFNFPYDSDSGAVIEKSIGGKENIKKLEEKIILINNSSVDELKKMADNGLDFNERYGCFTLFSIYLSNFNIIESDYTDIYNKTKLMLEHGAKPNLIVCKEKDVPDFIKIVMSDMALKINKEKAFKELAKKIYSGEGDCNLYPISKKCKDFTPDDKIMVEEEFANAIDIVAKERTPMLVDILRLLLKSGANINQKDFLGKTAIHYAVYEKEYPSFEILKFLIANKADLNVQDSNGITALHIAMMQNNQQAVKLLIESGADTNLKNYKGFKYNQGPLGLPLSY